MTKQALPAQPGPGEDPQPDPMADAGSALFAHDIRAALADVVGGLSLIDGAGLSQADRAQLARARVAADSLKALLERALSARQASAAGITQTVRERIELGPFLQALCDRWSGRAVSVGVAFAARIDPGLPVAISSDPLALARVLGNLLSNALKHAAGREVRLSAELCADGALEFTVEDDGPGLSRDALAGLFEFGGRPAGSPVPGSGMGLHIAHALAGALGGALTVANGERGVRACLRLPRAAWHDPDHCRSLVAMDGGAQAAPDLSGVHVLLAEDNPTNQLVASRMLAALNARCTVAADGQEALDLLARERFDLALVDIEMPRRSGLEVIAAIRAMPAPTGEMPVVALTAYVLAEHRARILAAGADAIMAKPIESIAALGRELAARLGRTAGAAHEGRNGPAATGRPEAEAAPDAELVPSVLETLLASVGEANRSELARRLDDDFDDAARRIQAALGAGPAPDFDALRRASHVLISVAGIVGAETLRSAATRLNAAAHAADACDAAELGADCVARIARARAAVAGACGGSPCA